MRWCWLVVVAACGDNGGTRIDAAEIDTNEDAASDAGPDAMPDAEVLGPWSTAMRTALPQDSDDPTMTADGLELYFNYNGDIYLATRAAKTDAFTTSNKVTELSATAYDTTPEVLPDGLTIYFASTRTPTVGMTDIWMSTRADRQSVWGTPVHVLALSTAENDSAAATLDNLRMVLCASQSGTPKIFETVRASTSDPWPTPVELSELTSGVGDCDATLTTDGLTIYYATQSSGGGDVTIATRESTSAPFTNMQTIDNVDTALYFEADPWLSLDGHTLLFESNQSGSYGIFASSR